MEIQNSHTPKNNEPDSKPLYTRSFFIVGIIVFIVALAVLCFMIGGISSASVQFFITSLLSFLVLIVIAAQADIYQRQWKAMQEGLNKSTEHFNASQRPSVGISHFIWEPLPDGQARINIGIKNSGRSPAKNVLITHHTKARMVQGVRGCPEPDEGIREPGRTIIPVGGQVTQYIRINRGIQEIMNETLVLFVWVYITYEDLGGESYFVETFAHYNPRYNQFRACETHQDAS